MPIREVFFTLFAVIAWGVVPSTSEAATTSEQAAAQPKGQKTPAEQIPATLQALEAARAGKYGKLRADERQRLEAAGRQIELLVARHSDLADLDNQERIQLFNAQETVMGIVADKQRTELVCTYRAQAGTRFRAKHCVTRDLADAQRKAAKDNLRGMQNPLCPYGEGGGCMTQMQRVNLQGEIQPQGFRGP
jgi:hypothetical protein